MRVWLLSLAMLACPLSAAAAEEERACVPGKQVACACMSGTTGYQRCKDDGAGFEACSCPPEPPPAPPTPPPTAPPSTSDAMLAPGEIPKVPEDARSPFGFHVGGGASLDNAALSAAAAVRIRYDQHWLFGFDGEWNPWISFETKRAREGTLNFYGTVIRRYPVSKWVTLRTTAHLGISTLLFSLYGAPAGSFGPYAGISLIGVEFTLSKAWKLIVDPSNVIYAAPHLTGAPLIYRQYRFAVGIQFGT